MLTNNHDEYSRTVVRSNGSKLDFCAYRSDKSLIIGVSHADGEEYQNITLSAQEVEQLLYHLTDAKTQAVFKPL